MKKLLLILLFFPIIGFGQWQLPAEFTAQADPINIMPISFTTDSSAVMSIQAEGDTLIITNWLWDFGDGTVDTVQNPIHSYIGFGNYTICLTVFAIWSVNLVIILGLWSVNLSCYFGSLVSSLVTILALWSVNLVL